ncbi:MAG: endonuclease/exonuclease/phosphatase family protein [SAR202 cluster bacterium]|nr:endonuclease/exonuclease/phosphatase family protein [SAR202 cluster bacterium]
MKIVTYNIQYARGRDDRFDLGRIAKTVGGADVIGLNEVERFWPRDGVAVDQPAELGALLPNYYWVYGPYFDMDASERAGDDKVINRRRQHGSMLLSLRPIVCSRLHVFSKLDAVNYFNMRMGAIEGVIEFPSIAVRFYSVHLGALSGVQRLVQVRQLLASHGSNQTEGGMWTGTRFSGRGIDWSCGEDPPSNPLDAIFMGDFNTEPDTPEYKEMVGSTAGENREIRLRHAFVDSWLVVGNGSDGATYFADPRRNLDHDIRIDYCFVGGGLADRLVSARVDQNAAGSDHQPLCIEIDL